MAEEEESSFAAHQRAESELCARLFLRPITAPLESFRAPGASRVSRSRLIKNAVMARSEEAKRDIESGGFSGIEGFLGVH